MHDTPAPSASSDDLLSRIPVGIASAVAGLIAVIGGIAELISGLKSNATGLSHSASNLDRIISFCGHFQAIAWVLGVVALIATPRRNRNLACAGIALWVIAVIVAAIAEQTIPEWSGV